MNEGLEFAAGEFVLLGNVEGKRVTFSWRERSAGYVVRWGGGVWPSDWPGGAGGTGGMVVCGLGEVRA